MTLDPAANAGRHALKERKNDLYETPECATKALLKYADRWIPLNVWEPACGKGAISRVLQQHNRNVWSTDLVDYGYVDAQSGIDFLMEQPTKTIDSVTEQEREKNWCILTNPPFKLADDFVRHALTLCPTVIMLLRLAFLEGTRRSDILDGGKLASVYVFRNRLPMMHRDGWEGERSTSATAFAWYVWSRHWNGPTHVRRISWE
jgi:hypothetical protein